MDLTEHIKNLPAALDALMQDSLRRSIALSQQSPTSPEEAAQQVARHRQEVEALKRCSAEKG